MLWRKAERELGMGVLFQSGRTGLCSMEDAVGRAVWREEDAVSQHGNWGLKDHVEWCLLHLGT